MAARSRVGDILVQYLKPMPGFLRLINQCSTASRSLSSSSSLTSLSPKRFPFAVLTDSPAFVLSRRFESIEAEKHLQPSLLDADDENKKSSFRGPNEKKEPYHSRLEASTAQTPWNQQQFLDFPGGKVPLTSEMRFISELPEERAHCYRVLDDKGQPLVCKNSLQVGEELAVKMYTAMVTLQILDATFYEAQRQGRISFYVTAIGEEAINIASAAALNADDMVFPQYREPGVLLWRGFTLQEFANQCFGNKGDYGKGRQMPIHYGSKKHNYFTISSTIATQLPNAVGAAYSLKMDGKDACVATYFGDGGTSEGDFHSALNFAAVMEAPVIFICRNNGWAISTPVSDQFRSDGIVVKGRAYGIRSIRVDGNDALAIYNTVAAARRMAITEHKPILIEALTYRVGHHSTSDDSTKYRSVDEIEWWRMSRDPATIFKRWIEGNGWWNDEAESELRSCVRKQLLQAIQAAEKLEKPQLADLFTDVYDVLPENLQEQEISLRETIERHPQDYPSDVPV